MVVVIRIMVRLIGWRITYFQGNFDLNSLLNILDLIYRVLLVTCMHVRLSKTVNSVVLGWMMRAPPDKPNLQ